MSDLLSHPAGMLSGMYREVAPTPALSGVVEAVWTRDAVPGPSRTHRVLPDGCSDLIWVDGELLVAGPDTRAHLDPSRPGSAYVAVRFAPGSGPTVLGVPGGELRDGRIPLAALWPAAMVRRLADRVTDAPDRVRALQALVVTRLARSGGPDPAAVVIARHQRAGRSVAETAAALGVSDRQLHRRSLAAFGYGPKTLGRILRFRQGLDLARGQVPLAEAAARAGYADQAHFAREVRALSGVTVRQLIR